MSDALLAVLRICLLVLVYLFFFRVVRAVWVEVRSPVPAVAATGGRRERRVEKRVARSRSGGGEGPALTVVEPPDQAGRIYHLSGTEVSIGRSASCAVTVDDTYVSQLHARVFVRDGQIMAEDLGSTNGSYLNRRRLDGAVVMQRGDRLQVGNTILELR